MGFCGAVSLPGTWHCKAVLPGVPFPPTDPEDVGCNPPLQHVSAIAVPCVGGWGAYSHTVPGIN